MNIGKAVKATLIDKACMDYAKKLNLNLDNIIFNIHEVKHEGDIRFVVSHSMKLPKGTFNG